jgi:DNA-directed RNA polymerase subunit RPC12/RpoP
MENMIILCIQCGAEFEFSIGDQLRHRKMNFDDPKRCPDCRKKKLKPPGVQDKRFNHRKKIDQIKYEY